MREMRESWVKTFCGDSREFYPWQEGRPGLCFNQVVVVASMNFLLAIASALYTGKMHSLDRSSHRLHTSWLISTRFALSLCVTLSFAAEELMSVWLNPSHPPAVWFGLGVGSIAWLVHTIFVAAARKALPLYQSWGPLPVLLAWIMTLLSSSYQLASVLKERPWSGKDSSLEWTESYGLQHAIGVMIRFSLQILYLFTLFYPFKKSQLDESVQGLIIQEDEDIDEEVRKPLLKKLDRTRYIWYGKETKLEEVVAEDGANVFSRVFFCWVKDLMAEGSKGRLDRPERLMLLPRDVRTSVIRTQFSLELQKLSEEETGHHFLAANAWDRQDDLVRLRSTESFEASQSRPASATDFGLRANPKREAKQGQDARGKQRTKTLVTALNRTFGWRYYPLGILKLLADSLALASPVLLSYLVTFIGTETKENHASSEGYYYALGLLLTTFFSSLFSAQFNYLVSRVGVQVRAALVTAVYQKALSVNTVRMQKFNTGKIVNFMSTDTDRIVNFCQSFHQFWSLPFQVGVALYLLHQQVKLAFLAGLGFALLLIPINRWVAIKIGQLSTEMMTQKDGRVKLMSEVLTGIRLVKFYAWEKYFKEKIRLLRSLELKSLKGRKYLDALCVYFWATTPVLMSILTFLMYMYAYKIQLTAAKVFTCVALFNMLISPLNAFPWVINGLVEAWVSVKRVQEFMWLNDLNPDLYYCDELPGMHLLGALSPGEPLIQLFTGHFSWQLPEGTQTEQSSSQRNALKNINLAIQSGQLVGVCGHVGAGKTSLLAAIMAEMRKTGGYIYVDNLRGGFAYAAQEAWIQHATVRDNILFGMPYDDQKYSRVIEACALQEDLAILPAGDQTEVGENGVTLSGGQKARIGLARAAYQDKPIYLLDDPFAAVDANVGAHLFDKCVLGLLRGKTRILCTHHTRFLDAADLVVVMEKGKIRVAGHPSEVVSQAFSPLKANAPAKEPADMPLRDDDKKEGKIEEDVATQEKGILVKEEEKQVGAVAFNVYKSYWLAIGNCLAFSVLISLFLMQASRNTNDWWLSYWVNHVNESSNFTYNGSSNLSFYLGVYGALAGGNSIFTLFRAFLYAYGGIRAATVIHKHLLNKILYAPVSFFDVTPIGRIINRFSSDIYAIDDSLPFMLNILLAQLFGVLGTIAVTCYGLPWFALALLPLTIIYFFIQRYYRRTSRELKRLSAVTLSPIYAHFSETLTGLASIRAYRQTERFAKENEKRLDVNQRANFGEYAAAQWLNIRLQMLGVMMVAAVAFIAVLEYRYGSVNPGLVGLALSYALSVTALLSGVVTAFTETEKLMVSVERAEEYIKDLPRETRKVALAPPGWPSHGVVSFTDVKLVYRDGIPPALNGVTFQTEPREKIGIVGRTGGGKSSLFACLFQMTDIARGEIRIDGIDITCLSQQSLRSRLAVIPQDPFLFSGSVRDNLDPRGNSRDVELWFILRKCHLKEPVETLGGLDANVGERGKHFSVGERQLLCLARAMLTKTKVLCIDEATASVDKQTDDWLQQAIREEFCHGTVLTIAHRIETVLDCDRVLVMDQGRVAEFAKPGQLLDDPASLFFQLARRSDFKTAVA
eukprot:m.283819 g.283819  ORF g.283819 m.283819 type:complete len:1577 (+) comp40673_c0_seq30:70-4800(+)